MGNPGVFLVGGAGAFAYMGVSADKQTSGMRKFGQFVWSFVYINFKTWLAFKAGSYALTGTVAAGSYLLTAAGLTATTFATAVPTLTFAVGCLAGGVVLYGSYKLLYAVLPYGANVKGPVPDDQSCPKPEDELPTLTRKA